MCIHSPSRYIPYSLLEHHLNTICDYGAKLTFLSTFRYFLKLHPCRIIADNGRYRYLILSIISKNTSLFPPKLTEREGSFPSPPNFTLWWITFETSPVIPLLWAYDSFQVAYYSCPFLRSTQGQNRPQIAILALCLHWTGHMDTDWKYILEIVSHSWPTWVFPSFLPPPPPLYCTTILYAVQQCTCTKAYFAN